MRYNDISKIWDIPLSEYHFYGSEKWSSVKIGSDDFFMHNSVFSDPENFNIHEDQKFSDGIGGFKFIPKISESIRCISNTFSEMSERCHYNRSLSEKMQSRYRFSDNFRIVHKDA